MPNIRAGEIDVYYERGGEGDALLFISGSGADLRNRPNQFDTPLAQAFELICYDQRGLGQTAKPAGEYTMAQYADDAAALLDALQIERVPIVGVSFGGMVGQEFVLRHPDRVSAAVLACTSSGGAGGASFPLHELHGLEPEERAQQHLRVADLRHTEGWIAENPERWQQRLALSVAAATAYPNPEGTGKQLQARRLHDTYGRLGQIEVPVCLAGGKYDGVAPPDNLRALNLAIDGSELKFFEGGHMFLAQDKSAWPWIVDWLRRQ